MKRLLAWARYGRDWVQYGLDWAFKPWYRIRALERELADFRALDKTGFMADGSNVDMTFSSPTARITAGLWVEFFHQNKGVNFVTMEMRFADPWWKSKKRAPDRYTVTVQSENGITPSQKIAELQTRITELEAQLTELHEQIRPGAIIEAEHNTKLRELLNDIDPERVFTNSTLAWELARCGVRAMSGVRLTPPVR